MQINERQIANKINNRIQMAEALFMRFIAEGDSPQKAIARARAAVDIWAEYEDEMSLGVPPPESPIDSMRAMMESAAKMATDGRLPTFVLHGKPDEVDAEFEDVPGDSGDGRQ